MFSGNGHDWEAGLNTTTITISGMSCGHCVSAVRKALTEVTGVAVQDVQVGTAVVEVESAEARAAAEAAIERAGFDVVKGRTLNVTSLPKQA